MVIRFLTLLGAMVLGFLIMAEAQRSGDVGQKPELKLEPGPPQIVEMQVPEYAFPGGSFNLFAFVTGPADIQALEVVIGREKTLLRARASHKAEAFTMDFTPRQDGVLKIALTPIGTDGLRGKTVTEKVRVGEHDVGDGHGGMDTLEFQQRQFEWKASGLTHLARYERGNLYAKGDKPLLERGMGNGSETFVGAGDPPVATDDTSTPVMPLNWWRAWQKKGGGQPFDYQTHCGDQVQAITPNGVVLRCWLKLNPKIGNLMVWSEVDPQTGAIPSATYTNWTASQKAQLDVAFYNAFKWLESGLTWFNGVQLQDPPYNQHQPQGDENASKTILNRTDAWNLYVATVAHSLALEIGGFTPWSVLNYAATDQIKIFHSHSMYWVNAYSSYNSYPDPQNPGGTLYGYRTNWVTHAPPTKAFQYFVDENLIRSSHFYTIARMLKWGREHMQHYVDWSTHNADTMYSYWNYVGDPPVSRIIDGVVYPDFEHLGAASWVEGCHGVASFFESVFRAINIPVEARHKIGGIGHATAVFTTIGQTLSHGDDVHGIQHYLANLDPTVYIRPEDILISYDQYNEWFVPPGPDKYKNVSRQLVEIMLDVLPNKLLNKYCADINAGAGYLAGSVYDKFDHIYSLPELIDMNLWSRLKQKDEEYGYCINPQPDCNLCHEALQNRKTIGDKAIRNSPGYIHKVVKEAGNK